jgi:hypothetical protein
MGNILNHRRCYNTFLKRKPKEVSIMLRKALGLGLIIGVIGVGGPSLMQMKQRLQRGKYQL